MGKGRGCCGFDGSEDGSPVPADAERVVDAVRDRYGKIAEGKLRGCGAMTEATVARAIGYRGQDLDVLPDGANLGLGCGAPIPGLALRPGETVLDLGSGPGLDAFLAAREVGPQGRVIGVDMTPAMLEKARASASRAGFSNVEFREGRLEALPVDDGAVDAVTSNCVINLVPDKAAVFREAARVLKPGGRLVVSDIILDGTLPEVLARDLLAYVGCIAGAMRREAYFETVEAAGLGEIRILRDIDYLEAAGYALPDGVREAMEREGIEPRDLEGVVRSVTFRAVKPS